MKFMLWCGAIVLLGLMTRGAEGGEGHMRAGNIEDWPHLASLWIAHDIDWFVKFAERIYLVTKDDRVYVFGNHTDGDNMFGVHIAWDANLAEPKEIVELQNKKIVKFATGKNFTLALSADGTVWGWGQNDYGQLGVGNTLDYFTPVLMDNASNVIDIIAVDYSSFVLTRSGQIFACGGNDNTVYAKSLMKLDIEQVTSLHSTFYGTSVAVTNSSQIYIWGLSAKSTPTLLQVSSKHVSVAATYYRYYILTEDGRIFRSIGNDELNGEVFYHGAIMFKALYADPRSNSFLIAESIDGELYMWTDASSSITPPVRLVTRSISQAFALHNYRGYLPFSVKLGNGLSCGYLCQVMEKMFNNQAASDTEFHIEGKTIYVDRHVLITVSTYMSQQFAGLWKDKFSIAISDYSYHLYYLYLHYLYTDLLNITPDEATDLYVLATTLHEEQLKERCHEIIKRGV